MPRSAQILRVEGDQTVEDVLKVVNAESTKIPAFMPDGGLPAVTPGASATATQNLAPDRYVIWEDEGGEGPPPVDFENGVGTSVIDGGIEQNISLDLKAGTYAVVCFLSDRKGGKSHAEQGMLKELTIE